MQSSMQLGPSLEWLHGPFKSLRPASACDNVSPFHNLRRILRLTLFFFCCCCCCFLTIVPSWRRLSTM